MSKKDKGDETIQPDHDEVVVATPESATEPAPKPARPGGIAGLALLLSLVALVAVAYTIVEDWRTQQDLELSSGNIEDSIINLGGRIDAARGTLSSIEAQLSALADADASASSDIDTLKRDVDDRLRQLGALPSRISNLETSLATLQGVSAGARDTWLLGEAEYYMQLANAQLQLAGNPKLAALALDMADERIVQLANPALTNIRRTISDELAALDGMATTDIEGITLTLSSLARVVDSLPLRRVERIEDDEPDATGEDVGQLDRAWNAMKQAASGLVKHRYSDQEIMPLIAPEAEYFLRTNLMLQLQTARLALLRGEQGMFEESLEDAAAWLTLYFDADSAQVSGAQQTISELRGGMFAVTPPDISESLRLLRQFNTVIESAR